MDNMLSAAEKKRLEALDKKIEKLKDKAIVKKKEYDDLMDQLTKLMEERYPEQKEARIKDSLYQAYQKSSLTLDEAVELLQNPEAGFEW